MHNPALSWPSLLALALKDAGYIQPPIISIVTSSSQAGKEGEHKPCLHLLPARDRLLSISPAWARVKSHKNAQASFPTASQGSFPGTSVSEVTRWVACSLWKNSKHWPEGQPWGEMVCQTQAAPCVFLLISLLVNHFKKNQKHKSKLSKVSSKVYSNLGSHPFMGFSISVVWLKTNTQSVTY